MASLRGKSPAQQQTRRAKFLVSGKPGVGKTWAALDFPNCYYIDVEGGATQPHYLEKLTEAGALYCGVDEGAQEIDTVIEEVKTLATTDHDRATLIIDSFSKLYNTAAAVAEEKVGSDYGKDRKEANKPTRRLLRWLDKLDMNVLLICHEKDKWGKTANGESGVVDQTFDAWDKLEYELDLWVQVIKEGNSRRGLIRKSRLLAFPSGESFKWDYEVFAERYGGDALAAKAVTLTLATADDVIQLEGLLREYKEANIRTEPQMDDLRNKWRNRARVDSFYEMTTEQIGKCAAWLHSKLETATAGQEGR